MSEQQLQTPSICMKLSLSSIYFILICHAAYLAILGGGGDFFLYDVGLILLIAVQYFYRLKWKWAVTIATINSVCLYIITTHLPTFLFYILAYAILLLLGGLKGLSWREKAIVLMLIAVGLMLYQQYHLCELLKHYAPYQHGETWQQAAAL